MMRKYLAIYLAINLVFSNFCFCKILPKDGGDKIIIKKGDTLWELARKYYNDPNLWPKFNEYNIIDNPGLIYPGERLAIGKDLASSIVSAMRQRIKWLEQSKADLAKKIAISKKEIEKLKQQCEKQTEELKKQLLSDEILRFRHQAEIEAMEADVLALQNEITQLSKEKTGLSVLLQARLVELDEKQKEIKRREDEVKLLEEKLQFQGDEINLLNLSVSELSEKLKQKERELKERDKRIQELKYEKGLYTSLAHFLIFALVSGIFALDTIN